MCFTNADSSPNAIARTLECSPSAPTTRSNARAAPLAKVTSTPSFVSRIDWIESSKTYSTPSLVASYNTFARSPRRISSSPLVNPSGSFATTWFLSFTIVIDPVRVSYFLTSSSSPIRSTTRIPVPRKSTAYPPGRMPGARSTTVTS